MENKDFEPTSKTVKQNGVYENPWDTWKFASLKTFLNWRFCTKNNTNLPSDEKLLDKDLPIHRVTDEEIKEFVDADTKNSIKLLWIGHATSLVNMENCIIMIDPVFSQRCSPSQVLGPKRFRDVPITVDRIPRVDAVIISHNHYDHLDYDSVMQLNNKFGTKDGGELNWFVGAGLCEWFKSCGINNNVHELEWWQSAQHSNSKFSHLKFIFTCAQHWSARGLTDKCKTLWGSWTVIGKSKKFFFAGDTGYCAAFQEIGKKYGPFDMATIPIGAYEPRCMMEAQHIDPEQAVKVHQDINSKKSVGVHWGTFALAYEYYMEPKSKLKEEIIKAGLDENCFITLEHGRSLTVE